MDDKRIMELLVAALERFDERRKESGNNKLFREEERVLIERQLRRVESATRAASRDRRLP